MAEITWIKLKTDMFDDEKIKLIERMPEGDGILIIWVKLLAYAGKVNCSGYIMIAEDIPMNVEEMAIIFNRPLEKVRYAIQVLQRYRMIDVDENERVCISNWEKHQNIDGMEKVRLQTAERNRKYRERKKQQALQAPESSQNNEGNVSVTSRDGIDKELEIDKEIDKEQELLKEGSASPPSPVVAVVNPFNFYAQNGFGLTMNDITREKIVGWCNDLSDELVIHAMQIAMERNSVSWSYAEGILKKWHAKGVKSLKDVDALLAQFEAQRAQKNRSHGNQRTENIPEWFSKHQAESAAAQQKTSEPIDFEAERAKVLAKLGGE